MTFSLAGDACRFGKQLPRIWELFLCFFVCLFFLSVCLFVCLFVLGASFFAPSAPATPRDPSSWPSTNQTLMDEHIQV